MKTQLTEEQSRKLIELGVDYRKASTSISTISSDGSYYIQHIFTLADVIDLLPREWILAGRKLNLTIEFEKNRCFLSYRNNGVSITDDEKHRTNELIDCLYYGVLWLIDNGKL